MLFGPSKSIQCRKHVRSVLFWGISLGECEWLWSVQERVVRLRCGAGALGHCLVRPYDPSQSICSQVQGLVQTQWGVLNCCRFLWSCLQSFRHNTRCRASSTWHSSIKGFSGDSTSRVMTITRVTAPWDRHGFTAHRFRLFITGSVGCNTRGYTYSSRGFHIIPDISFFLL